MKKPRFLGDESFCFAHQPHEFDESGVCIKCGDLEMREPEIHSAQLVIPFSSTPSE